MREILIKFVFNNFFRLQKNMMIVKYMEYLKIQIQKIMSGFFTMNIVKNVVKNIQV